MDDARQPKTFEEIDAKLHADLKQISAEIAEIENHLQIGQQMFEDAVSKNLDAEVVQQYKKGLEELQKGLEMFLGLKDEIQQTIAKLHGTRKQAEEHIR